MGDGPPIRPVLLILAIFSRHREAIAEAGRRAEAGFGPIAFASELFPFDQTAFYDPTMGTNLLKQLVAFRSLIDPARLPEIKRETIAWERAVSDSGAWPEPRPVNFDPGYVTEAKLVLATTKDRDHRLYLGHGIYGEVTLYFHAGQWQSREWTYPDYRQRDYHQFLTRCREFLRQCYRSHG